MIKVAGVDLGTLSVRVSIFDQNPGAAGRGFSALPAASPCKRSGLCDAEPRRPDGGARACDARRASAWLGLRAATFAHWRSMRPGSSVLVLDEALKPLSEYYLWCDHRAWKEAGEITRAAHAAGLEAIKWCGGSYSSEWGWSKLLHWLRHNPELRGRFGTAIENCDMVTATLCGVTDAAELKRSVCAMGHKWMWGKRWGGLPSEEFLSSVDPLLAGIPREDWRRIPYLRLRGRNAERSVVGAAWARRGHPFAGRRAGCALGRSGRAHPVGRCGQRDRHLHLHYREPPNRRR